jgi:NAD-reducing hydrogenase large subunit
MTLLSVLEEIARPYGARVVVARDQDGRTESVRLDLTGFPRVDALLPGRPVAEVPALVERLCGICPAAHHLAGMRALEALAGLPELTATAESVRRLLHHGSAVSTHAGRFISSHAKDSLLLRTFGRSAMAAAGSPKHFPTTAVFGGVAGPVPASARDELSARLPAATAAAVELAEALLSDDDRGRPFTGADVALVDRTGRPDLLGERLRAVTADGEVVHAAAQADSWEGLVAEAEPGRAAPRPYLVSLGPQLGTYRVGPVAQLRVGELTTVTARRLQERWLATGGSAGAAQAIMMLHSVEAIGALLESSALVAGPTTTTAAGVPRDEGVGWVDGPRGLLVHRYVTAGGVTSAVTILTPTAQNEPWLAGLLRTAVDASPADAPDRMALEMAIRDADPCLPYCSAPPGTMDVRVDTVMVPTVIEGG